MSRPTNNYIIKNILNMEFFHGYDGSYVYIK